jgi:hypothetical protein
MMGDRPLYQFTTTQRLGLPGATLEREPLRASFATEVAYMQALGEWPMRQVVPWNLNGAFVTPVLVREYTNAAGDQVREQTALVDLYPPPPTPAELLSLAQTIDARVAARLVPGNVEGHSGSVAEWDPRRAPLTDWYPDGPTPKMTSEEGRASSYARRLLNVRMRPRWLGSAGEAVRSMGPQVWAGVPGPALMGKTANSVNFRERSTANEIGLYQTLGGRAAIETRPADASGVYPWQKPAAIPDQVAVGLWDIQAGYAATLPRIPPELRPVAPGGQWAWMLGVMGYTAGGGGAAFTVRRYAERLAGARETARYGTLLLAVAEDPNPPREPVGHAVARSFQQLMCGKLLDDSLLQPGQERSHWYDLEFDRPLPAGTGLGDLELSVSGSFYAGPRGPLVGQASTGPGAELTGPVEGGGSSLPWLLLVGLGALALVVYLHTTSGPTLVLSPSESARWRAGDARIKREVGDLAARAARAAGKQQATVLYSDKRLAGVVALR